jgi:hypothetical protein
MKNFNDESHGMGPNHWWDLPFLGDANPTPSRLNPTNYPRSLEHDDTRP